MADLTEPLPFDDGAFDDVVASLVLHYFEDWGPTLREVHRVLVPGGRLIASVHHPTADYCIERLAGNRPDYFATASWTDVWTMGGHTAEMRFWSRPLHAMTDAFTAAGFGIEVISEPQPEPEARELFPEEFELMATGPSYLFFVLRSS